MRQNHADSRQRGAKLMGWPRRTRGFIGLDFHTGMTVLMRSWTSAAGVVTVLLLSTQLTAQQQGYYYTFATLLALQVFFELGLNQVVVQTVSRESAHTTISADGGLGDPRAAARVGAFTDLLRRWYRVAALLFAALVGAAGFVLFEQRGVVTTSQWLPVWIALVVVTSLNLRMSPLVAVAEGLGHVGQAARLRLNISLVGYVGMWSLLIAGGDLWAVAVLPSVSVAGTGWWLNRRYRHASSGAEQPGRDAISWRRDILPFQWRISISWVSGYFIFSFFTPVVFARFGAVEAGRTGMTLTVLIALTTVSLSWVNAKVPTFAAQVRRGERAALNALFRRVASTSTVVATLGCGTLLTVVVVARHFDISAASRITPPSQLTWLCVATVANIVTYSLAAYMRAHFEEPMLAQSVVLAALVASAALLAPSPTAIFASYAFLVTFVGLPWTWVLFQRFYSRRDPEPRAGVASS